MRRVKVVLDKTIAWVLVMLMAASVINVLWQVFTRFILGDPSSFTEELARYLLIWIGVLGAGYVVGQRAHLALELLPERLSGRRRQLLEIVIQGSVILFATFVMVLGGMRLVYVQLKLGQASPSLELPLGLVYLVLPLSGLLMVFYAITHLTGQGEAPRSEEDVLRLHAEESPSGGSASRSDQLPEAAPRSSQRREEGSPSDTN